MRRSVQVRCLGPGPEHTFWSASPRKNRICKRCERKMGQQSRSVACIEGADRRRKGTVGESAT